MYRVETDDQARDAITSLPAEELVGYAEVLELLHRYSNRDDLLKSLVSVLDRVSDEPVEREEEAQLASADGPTPRAWQLSDRLSPADVKTLVASYLGGSTIRDLAERYGIGTSSVKRLLRKHGARKQRAR